MVIPVAKTKKIRKNLPEKVLGKRINTGKRMRQTWKLSYLIRWKFNPNLPQNEQGEKWVNL